jgi:hypothetical protein
MWIQVHVGWPPSAVSGAKRRVWILSLSILQDQRPHLTISWPELVEIQKN